jgi:hypothetical protein
LPLIRRHRYHVVSGEPQHDRFYLFRPWMSVSHADALDLLVSTNGDIEDVAPLVIQVGAED